LIDLHSHVIPSLDDGPTTLEGSLEILHAACEAGVTRIAATPHVRDDHPTTPEQMERGVAELRPLAPEGLEILTGGELDIRYLRTLDDAARRRGSRACPRRPAARRRAPGGRASGGRS